MKDFRYNEVDGVGWIVGKSKSDVFLPLLGVAVFGGIIATAALVALGIW